MARSNPNPLLTKVSLLDAKINLRRLNFSNATLEDKCKGHILNKQVISKEAIVGSVILNYTGSRESRLRHMSSGVQKRELFSCTGYTLLSC